MIVGKYDIVGTRAPRLDAPAKVTGQALYVNDLRMPGMLFGALLQSPLAHAKILNIDTTRAKRLPGVKSVVTSEDAGLVKYAASPARYDETLFCHDKVRYVGDEIAAVAAVDLETALEAAALIKVDYEELPAVLDPFKAMEEGAPLIHDDHPRNIMGEVHHDFGEIEKALAKCDYVRTDSFSNKHQDGGFIEPQSCLAVYDLQGNLTLYTATQSVHFVQRTTAQVLKLPVGKVRVIKPYVGGGFGPKIWASSNEMGACLLSMKTGRPVKMTYTREQVFLYSRARHQYFHELTTGVMKDGTLVAVKNKAVVDGGAYSNIGIASIYYAGAMLGGPYKLSHLKYDGYRIYTNKPPKGAQRGHGSIIARTAWEQQLDTICTEQGWDPIEFRLKNAMDFGDVTVNKFNLSSLGLKECLRAVEQESEWKEKRGRLPKGKGIGMACGFFVCGAGYPIYRTKSFHSSVTIKVSEDGGIVYVFTGAAEIGQGSDTTMAMIAAETIGVPLSEVRVRSGDTESGLDMGAWSSRQTLATGHATKSAAEKVKSQIVEALAEEFGILPHDIDIRKGFVVFKKGQVDFSELRKEYARDHVGWTDHPAGEFLAFREAARLAYLRKGTIVGVGDYKPPKLGGEFKGAAVGTSPAYSSSALVAEVTVDEETGQVTVDKITDAHDCGKAINLTSVEGQIEGSVSMGLGEALFEEIKYDEKGRILNPNLAEYKIPTALDGPEIKAIVVETNEPNGPFGAKEVGEGAILPTIPAILNAVYDAVGVRINELPLTPERVYRAIKEKKMRER